MTSLTSMCEVACQIIQKKLEEKQLEEKQAVKAQSFTPSEPVDSLSMGDEHLNTILATKSDEFIKSCVENLVPNPSESEGESECEVPAGFTTFSNVLFNADYDFDSGDDQSTFDEDFPEKIYSNPLFDEEINPMKIDHHPLNAESDLIGSMPNHDSSITISSKIDSLFDEFTGELTLLKSILPGIDETDCHPEKETRFTKRLLYDNSSPRIEDDDYDSRRDTPILEELLDNYSLSLPNNESYHFDIPSPYRLPVKPPDGKTRTLNIKMMDDQKKQEEKWIKEEQAAKAQNWKLLVCYDDDDDEESSNSLEDNIISEFPSYSVVTPSEPVDSLNIGDEHLNTIPATESDEFIKSSVENLVPIPSDDDESSHEEDNHEVSFKTYSNPLFDLDEEIISSEFNLIHIEDLESTLKNDRFDTEPYLLESLPNRDTLMSSPLKIDSLLTEFAGALIFLKSIPPGIDEADCNPEEDIHLVKRLLNDNSLPRPSEEIVSDNSNADIESFSPSPIPNKDSDSNMEEMNLPFTPDDPMSSGIEEEDYDSGRDIPILEELLDNYSLSLLDNESYHFDIPSPYRPPAKPPDGKTGTLNIKMMGEISDQKGLEALQPFAECPMIINGKNIPLLDVPIFHFYPL
nr:hypothetical protein [Tanacetum cinerariifolium]